MGICFCSVIRKRNKPSSPLTHKQPKHTVLYSIKNSQPQPRGSILLRKPALWHNVNLGKMGVGNWYGRRKRRAELSIYLPFRSAFWRIQFDWLPSDCKRALNREMHQDFSVNARVPPKRTSERLENTSSALSWRSPCNFPNSNLSVHYLHLQSVLTQQNPNIRHLIEHYKLFVL